MSSESNYPYFVLDKVINPVFCSSGNVADKTRQSQEKTPAYNFIEELGHLCQYQFMYILVDGYNLIRQSDFLRRFEQQEPRGGTPGLNVEARRLSEKKGT